MTYAWIATRPTVRPGDSLSGLVAGFADLHGMGRQDAMTHLGWPPDRRRSETCLDILAPDPPTVARIAERTALSVAQVRSMTLDTFDGFALDFAPVRAKVAERRSAGASRYTRRALRWASQSPTPGCVPCLQERPYGFQIAWRLGLIPGCDVHQLTLVSHCPVCGKVPFQPLDPYKARSAREGCRHCGLPLKELQSAQMTISAHQSVALRQISDLHTASGSMSPERAQQVVCEVSGWLKLMAASPCAHWKAHESELAAARACTDIDAGIRATLSRVPVLPPAAFTMLLLPGALALATGEGPDAYTREELTSWANSPQRRRKAIRSTDVAPIATHLDNYRTRVEPRATHSTPQHRPPTVPRAVRTLASAHIPVLCPMPTYTRRFADLIHDALGHGDRGYRLSTLRAAVGIAMAVTFSGHSVTRTLREVDGAHNVNMHKARTAMGSIVVGLDTLGRHDDYLHAVAAACIDLATGPRVDYQMRAATLPPTESTLDYLHAQGLPALQAQVWLAENYACLPVAVLGVHWSTASSAHLGEYLPDIDEQGLADELDRRARAA